MAECPDLGDGRGAGGVGARDRPARRVRRPRRDLDTDAEEAFKAPIIAQYERQGSPYYSTARLWDDGIIDPAETRRVIGMALAVSADSYGLRLDPGADPLLRHFPDVAA